MRCHSRPCAICPNAQELWPKADSILRRCCLGAQIVQWAPQNDLLGSGHVKAFLTHGGINGLYEVRYPHGNSIRHSAGQGAHKACHL